MSAFESLKQSACILGLLTVFAMNAQDVSAQARNFEEILPDEPTAPLNAPTLQEKSPEEVRADVIKACQWVAETAKNPAAEGGKGMATMLLGALDKENRWHRPEKLEKISSGFETACNEVAPNLLADSVPNIPRPVFETAEEMQAATDETCHVMKELMTHGEQPGLLTAIDGMFTPDQQNAWANVCPKSEEQQPPKLDL